ncbi:hypothetical protein JTE90_011089 [Oedothorax gibbosus]|uniref:Retropepsins domain-containing protein n=1 Tax=Oedothorax gibbosus TaxID=931172 RepID=A0AAV6UMW7_9ARAC|nr:hypothetical protein JTE90_011089 [Oedothorax gibbosus]
MATFGTTNGYDPEAESWAQYTERLEQFFIANGIAKVCMSKSKGSRKENIHESRPGKVNQVIEPQTEEDYQQYELFNLRCEIDEAPPAAKVTCSVEGQDMTFELDSGAPFSLIPLSVYKQNATMPALQKANVRLQSYTKHSIQIEGAVEVLVTFRGKSSILPLLVVKDGSVSMAGRNWIARINIRLQGKTPSFC